MLRNTLTITPADNQPVWRFNLTPEGDGLAAPSVRIAHPLVDEILEAFAPDIGRDLRGYRNHVFRVLNYYEALSGQASEVPASVLIAAAFHDLGIWTDQTFDYLPPSMHLATTYLLERGLGHLEAEVHALIAEHHKLSRYAGARHEEAFADRVETFRRADHVDVSLGVLRFGLSRSTIVEVKRALPDAGFHRRLAVLSAAHFLKSPLRPLPMVHW